MAIPQRREPIKSSVMPFPPRLDRQFNQPTPAGVPTSVERLIDLIKVEFPQAHIRVTGRDRTPRRQAELMASDIMKTRANFMRTYLPSAYKIAMVKYVTDNPKATVKQVTDAFELIVRKSIKDGHPVSNHLSGNARDISIPMGGVDAQAQVLKRLETLGAHVILEGTRGTGPHWHVDYFWPGVVVGDMLFMNLG